MTAIAERSAAPASRGPADPVIRATPATPPLPPRPLTSPAAQTPRPPAGHPAADIERLLGELDAIVTCAAEAAHRPEAAGAASAVGRVAERSLDLIAALLAVGAEGIVDYRRPRGAGDSEGNGTTARSAVASLRDALGPWAARPLGTVVRVERQAGPFGETERTWSTVGNEAAFVVNHVVDRLRICRHLLASCGIEAPAASEPVALAPLRARSTLPPHWALWRLLDEMGGVIAGLPHETYRARPAAAVSGSIGEHVRHALDHVAALVAADPAVGLSYDGRRRQTGVETQPSEAVAQIAALKRELDAWAVHPLDEPLRVTSMTSASGDTVSGLSTRARELAFVVSHTIHHQAMIGLLLAMHGHAVPVRFGHAPSTPTRWP